MIQPSGSLARLLIATAGTLLVAGMASARPLEILRITPAGDDVPAEQQIVFQFDRPVVPVGRMQRSAAEIPIEITPDPGCEWRWLNTSTLVCQLSEKSPLRPSTRYRLEVRPGIRTEVGDTLAETRQHTFLTRRPAVDHVWFETWMSPGTPKAQVTFNQPVTRESLEARLTFRDPAGAAVGVQAEAVDEVFTSWWVSPVRELPPDRLIGLHVAPGVASRLGSEPGVEDRDIVTFRTFPAPRFLGIACTDLAGNQVTVLVDRKAGSVTERCDPLRGVALIFNSPVIKDVLARHLRFQPDLAGGRADYDPWANIGSWSQLGGIREQHEYHVYLPEILKAFAEYHVTGDAEGLRDEFDRPLTADIDFRFRTDHRRPALHLGHPASVLEAGVETHLPVIVTNLQHVDAVFDRLTAAGVQHGQKRRTALDRVQDIAFRAPLRIREWLAAESGAVVGELSAGPAQKALPPEWFFSQVTPFQVHVKLGHYNTLVWVTDLQSGLPVGNAVVDIVRMPLSRFDDEPERLARSTTDERGLAELDGTGTLDPELSVLARWKRRDQPHLFVRVQQGAGLGLVPLSRDFLLRNLGPNESWVATQLEPRHGHLITWGTTAQGVYRVGDTIQYKLWVRDDGNERLEPAPRSGYTLRVLDPTGKNVFEKKDLALSEFGALDGEFKVPETAAVGWYRFELIPDFAPGGRTWTPLTVLVSDFTPAPFRVTPTLNAELFQDGERVTVDTDAQLHSGGPYVDAQARVTATLRSAVFQPDDPRATGFEFDTGYGITEALHGSEGSVDGRGQMQTSFDARTEAVLYGTLTVESAVRDDRGRYIAGSAEARFAARDRYVGLRQQDWVLSAGQPAEFQAVVTDARGKLAAGTAIDFKVERRVTRASRVKGAGNAYLTHYIHEWQVESTCRALSESDAAAACAFTPGHPGVVRLSATIQDTEGRELVGSTQRWVAGQGVVLWEEPPGHHLQIYPEQETLAVGDTARYLIQNPYPGAEALVTVERNGVLRHWVQTLADSTAIVEFPVEPDFIPGFYLSVVVTSPRVETAPVDGEVDLGKPGFRMGYARTTVRDAFKELAIEVVTDAAVYKPRDRVVVDLLARTSQGDIPRVEFAVAVLDEAVLDLLQRGAENFDPYAGFYNLGPLDLWNYNLLTNLIGIQKFEQKGANPGGGGGGDAAMRSRFKFVSYWNPSIGADADGRARIEFEVPDNLTGWRILAMAATPEDKLGLGQGSFKVNRPTEIRPALPNQVLEGDLFRASFSVMNRTDETRTLAVSASATGSVEGKPQLARTIEAEPYKRYIVGLPLRAGKAGEVRLAVRAGDDRDADGLEQSVPVRRKTALLTAATYGTTTEDAVRESLLFPPGIQPDVGGVSVAVGPTVISGLEGAFEYLRDYPYQCWEQSLTKGVMAAHFVRLRDYLPDSLTWDAAAALPQATLELAANFQAPNGGMTYYRPREEYVSPYLSAYTALAFTWLRGQGYDIPAGVEERLHEYLLTLLRRDVFPTFYSKGMASSVRAVALAALGRAGKIERADLDRYRDHVPRMDLFGKAHYLQALSTLDGTAEDRRTVQDAILSHAEETGGKLAFTEALDDGYARILHSELRTSCSILTALVGQGPAALQAAGAADLPFKIVRAITQTRQGGRRWENTQENMFCLNALVDYAEVYEKDAPDFTVKVDIERKTLGSAHFADLRAEPVEFQRAIDKRDPGRQSEVRIARQGTGRLYYSVRMSYSPSTLEQRSIQSGIEVRREYSVERGGAWVLLSDPMKVRQGELVRVDLYVSFPAPRNFVVVEDPVPGGLEPVNRDLATASEVDADKAVFEFPPDAWYRRYDDWQHFAYTRWSFYHQELRNDSARFYSEYLPAGRYHLSYVAQVIAAGEFSVLPLHAEEMYEPDVYGQGLPARLVVEAAAP